jgi:hypothetical protein
VEVVLHLFPDLLGTALLADLAGEAPRIRVMDQAALEHPVREILAAADITAELFTEAGAEEVLVEPVALDQVLLRVTVALACSG